MGRIMAAFEITPDMNERDVAAIEIVNPMLERLSARRAKQVVVEGHLAKSKIAWNVARYQQALLYRVVMLADGCASNWNLGNPLCSLLAARALTETVALLLVFKDRLQRLLEEEDLGGIHALTLNASFATRDAEWLKQHPESEAVSVLTHLDKLDETEDLAGIRAEYEELSERCHPNSPGTLFFFGTLDRTSGATSYSEAKRDADSLNRVLSAACMVGFAEKAFSHLDDAITKIAELQDRVNPVGGAC